MGIYTASDNALCGRVSGHARTPFSIINDTGSLSTDTFTELRQVSFLSHTVAAFFKLGNSLEMMNGILVSPIYCRALSHAV